MRSLILATLASILTSGCNAPIPIRSSGVPGASPSVAALESTQGASVLGAWFYAEGRCLERYEFAKTGFFYSSSNQELLKGRFLAEDLQGEPPVIRVTQRVDEDNRKDDCTGPSTDKKGQTYVRYVLMAADRASIRVCVSADGKGCVGPLTRRLPPTPWLSYGDRVNAVFKPYVHFPEELLMAPSLRSNPATEVEVRSEPDGRILSFKMLASSGTKSWDDAVLMAVRQVDTLPSDYQGKVPPVLIIGFRPHP
ncbi:TonB C-terminal domain-containing protein [Variovorax sp. J22P271]|uniref:TonB C-terminal domain-containing protein n=1 Tax=Variovorax davisae TaxID=3053515 RepID=UPI002578736C|nr:TonB C-terminal domain-containing protein [Variovorax sp. J22P271]MDM0032057.1 TonB C-terminal domain-containing protein [Variovorax sp. J22P271]